MICNATMSSQFEYVYDVGLHLVLLYLWTIKKKLYSPSWSHLPVLNSVSLDREFSFSPSFLCSIVPVLQLKHSLWHRVRFHYRPDKKDKHCLGKLCFKGQLQGNSFLVWLIFILRSHISQEDSWISCELYYMLLS